MMFDPEHDERRLILTWLSSVVLFSLIAVFDLAIIRPTNKCHAEYFTWQCSLDTAYTTVQDPTVLMALVNALAGTSATIFLVSAVLWVNKRKFESAE